MMKSINYYTWVAKVVLCAMLCCSLVLLLSTSCFSQTTTDSKSFVSKRLSILSNQVAYDSNASKKAMLKSEIPLSDLSFTLFDIDKNKAVLNGKIKKSTQVLDWGNPFYSEIDFSEFEFSGNYKLQVSFDKNIYESAVFKIGDQVLGEITIPAILSFFQHQRANFTEELEADRHLLLYGSSKTVDLRGGWCDASGDVSKYFSHLAYTNFMLPQQIPLVTWTLTNCAEKVPSMQQKGNDLKEIQAEALYGADYLMRSLSPEGYFYMTVFSYFNKNPEARRVAGLLADSKTTTDYQCAYREGGGMAIAALARISTWEKDGDFTSKAYLIAAKRAFSHLQEFSIKYDDDHKNNIIDDYCALLASTELWMASGEVVYKAEAKKRAQNLVKRQSSEGYFIADDNTRPFWHASDAGLPIIALARYLEIEKDFAPRTQVLATIKKYLVYQLAITNKGQNPFGYPRQNFTLKGELKSGFFIPHENESGWWWQGEDARLASVATAAIIGGRLVFPDKGAFGIKPELGKFATNIMSWILGNNPYNICMMYGFGKNNVPYMAAMYGHGTGKGGISNGITGKDGNTDGSGIDFKTEDNGNEWRWSEQWIPHTAWFLNAVTAMSEQHN